MKRMRLARRYLEEMATALRQKREGVCLRSMLFFFPRWRRSIIAAGLPDDRVPWLTYGAIDFIGKIVRPWMRVFEYGSGSSTLFFTARVRQLVSVEHDKVWCDEISEKLREKNRGNTDIALVEPEREAPLKDDSPANPDAYRSERADKDFSFKRYAAYIDRYPDHLFDIVLVDGRARPSCCKHAVRKVKSGGFLILDNSERERYRHIHVLLDGLGWKKRTFFGPGPRNHSFWQTCIWQRATQR